MTKIPSYDELACKLLGMEVLPLALPKYPVKKGDPIHNPGGLPDELERELEYQVCRYTDLKPDKWSVFDENERITWMRLAIDKFLLDNFLDSAKGLFEKHSSNQCELDQITSLKQLVRMLDRFIDEEQSSDSEDRPKPINPGHYLHDAVCGVGKHYRANKLPGMIRPAWIDLLQITRGKLEFERPNQAAIEAAVKMMQWANQEISSMTNWNHENESVVKFSEILEWSKNELKGKQQRLIKILVDHEGNCKLTEIAKSPGIDWQEPWDDAFNSMRKTLNKKMKTVGLGWQITRYDNKAKLSKIGQK